MFDRIKLIKYNYDKVISEAKALFDNFPIHYLKYSEMVDGIIVTVWNRYNDEGETNIYIDEFFHIGFKESKLKDAGINFNNYVHVIDYRCHEDIIYIHEEHISDEPEFKNLLNKSELDEIKLLADLRSGLKTLFNIIESEYIIQSESISKYYTREGLVREV